MEQLLTAIFSISIKDDLVDALIVSPILSGFTMSEIDGYSSEHSQYDIREQVIGYRRMCRVEVLHKPDQQTELLQTLAKVAGSGHLRYWITPMTKAGVLGSAAV